MSKKILFDTQLLHIQHRAFYGPLTQTSKHVLVVKFILILKKKGPQSNIIGIVCSLQSVGLSLMCLQAK